jgi:hypothetical protein
MNGRLDATTADRIIEALRIGEVPEVGLEAIGTGIEEYLVAFERELPRVARGDGRVRFLRGDFGTGKTFFLKSFAARARSAGFATAYVRISYPEPSLGKPLSLYAATARDLHSPRRASGAFRETVDAWLYRAMDRVGDPTYGAPTDVTDPGFDAAVDSLFDEAAVYAQVVAAYSRALGEDQTDIARGLLQWLSGDEHVDASVKRYAHVKGSLTQLDALSMFSGLVAMLTQSGSKGLVILVDEVERVLRRPQNQRADAYRAIQNLIGALTTNLKHVLLVVAGTTSFYEDRKGIRELEPLRQRIETSFDEAYPDLEAVQVRLPPFDRSRLIEVGRRIRAVYVDYIGDQSIGERIDDEIIGLLADDVIGAFGGDIAVAPRQFFRRLISTLGKAKTYPEYDPRADRVDRAELVREVQLSDPEREALGEARIAMPLDL